MTDADWARWAPVLAKMISDLKALNAYLHGDIGRAEYCGRMGIDGTPTHVSSMMRPEVRQA
jgi:hypothetical protein